MQNAQFLVKYKLHHLLLWLMVFGIWYFLRYQDYDTTGMALMVTLIKVTDLALMIYFTNYVLIPKLLYKKKYGWFALAFITMIVTSSFAKMNILGHLTGNVALLTFSGNLKARIYDNVIPHFFLVLSGAAIKLMTDYTSMQQRMVEMAKEKAEAELNFLKSQINPHFLFNSINSVYFLIEKNNTAAREALHKFSDMLRYQLYEMNGDMIPVEKEINYLQDYVDLQKLRKDENYAVDFNCSTAVQGFSIEPLLLIPFVENAFKHISHHKNQVNFIRLDMNMNSGTLHFSIENSKEAIEEKTDRHKGIGLNNVKRRLELLYPGKHQLTIINETDTFNVNLAIKI
jgi:two-component system LytT family sensor kinase